MLTRAFSGFQLGGSETPSSPVIPDNSNTLEKATPPRSEVKSQITGNPEKTYEKLNVGEDQNQYVRYASKISDNDLDFLSTLEAENGLWTPDRKSTIIGSNGYRDIGFCQINPGFHPEITNDKRFLIDPLWQLDQCLILYRGGTTFYGYQHRNTVKNRFILK